MNPLNDTLNLSTYGCLAPLSGTYTIGGQNADFASISEANTIIGFCGINGPVVFELAPGLYSNVSFTGTYLGADSINTVTFTSASGKADSVIFNGMPNGISISNVHHLTITHVTVDAFGADYGILIGDSCSNLEISHCNIICDPAITSTQAGIRYYNNTTLSDNIRLIGNTINGGYYGIYFYGVSQTSHPSRIRIDSNVLTNQYYYATYCYYSDFTSISHNIVQCRDYNARSNYYGIRTYYCNSSEIIGNKITSLNPSITNPYGMYIYYSNCFDTIPVVIANNDIRIHTTSTYYGLYLGYALADLYHNSILTLGEGNARGIYMTTNTYNCFYNWYNNNIVALSGDASYPVYLSTSNAYTADYNNYYSSGDNLGYIAGAKETLDEMRQYGQDTHSVNIMPDYVDMAYDLRLRKGTGMECPQEPLFPYDIEHETRGSTTFMGAYVETDLINNAKLVAFTEPTAATCIPGDIIDVSVILFNRADSVLKNVNIYWTVNGVQQTMYPWTGNLLPDERDTLYLGSFVGAAAENNIFAYSSMPNGKVDDLQQDDSIRFSIYGCPSGSLSGNYTVGTPSSNFTSFKSLITALSNCGISGPVVIDVADGHYPDLHIIGAFPGADSINTVLFRAASGNKNNVVIGASSSSGDGMILNDAAYLRFEHMTFGTTASTAAGVKVQNTLTDVTFDYCNMYSMLGASGNAYCCLSLNNSVTMMVSGLKVNNCVLQGGYINVHTMNCGETSSIFGDITIDSSQLIDAVYYGIYSQYPGNIRFTIRHNEIKNHASSSTYYGMKIGSITSRTDIDTCMSNRFRCSATSTNYGIQIGQTVNYYGQLTGKYAYIANNEIIITGGSSQNRGLHFENMGYIAYYANSVHIEGTGGTSYGYYMTNTSTSYVLKLKYNNFYVNNPNGIAYTVWHSAGSFAPGLVEFDYNNYYTTGQYVASNFTTLNDWITASQEVTALNERVNFIDYPNSLKTDGKRAILPVTPEVPLDILDSVRFSYTNMGCYDDFVPSTFDAKMEEIVSPVNGIPVGVNTSVDIKISNAGYILDSVEIHWMANGILQPTYYWKDTNGLSFGETSNVFTIGNFTPVSGQNTLVIWTENPNSYPDGNVFNDTMMITLVSCDSALYGTYTVGTPTSHFPTLEEVVDKLSNCMLAGPVTFVM
ncbi:MAG: hypothetical protein PHG64_14720, partial [Paludibacter sp.]|nr:hypothetical protein [Paludibacter sp.]